MALKLIIPSFRKDYIMEVGLHEIDGLDENDLKKKSLKKLYSPFWFFAHLCFWGGYFLLLFGDLEEIKQCSETVSTASSPAVLTH